MLTGTLPGSQDNQYYRLDVDMYADEFGIGADERMKMSGRVRLTESLHTSSISSIAFKEGPTNGLTAGRTPYKVDVDERKTGRMFRQTEERTNRLTGEGANGRTNRRMNGRTDTKKGHTLL